MFCLQIFVTFYVSVGRQPSPDEWHSVVFTHVSTAQSRPPDYPGGPLLAASFACIVPFARATSCGCVPSRKQAPQWPLPSRQPRQAPPPTSTQHRPSSLSWKPIRHPKYHLDHSRTRRNSVPGIRIGIAIRAQRLIVRIRTYLIVS